MLSQQQLQVELFILKESKFSFGYPDLFDKVAYRCVLELDNMTFYRMNKPANTYLTLEPNGLKFRFKKEDGNFATSKSTIILFKSGGANVHPDHKEVKLSSKSATDIRLWAKSLSRVIVSVHLALLSKNVIFNVFSYCVFCYNFHCLFIDIKEFDDMNRFDPLENDVDRAYDQITSYMRITKKTLCDMVPKAITLFIIRELEEFIETHLLIILLEILNDEDVSVSF